MAALVQGNSEKRETAMKSEQQEFFLTNPKTVEPASVWVPDIGWHLLHVRVEHATFENLGEEKPYINVHVIVTDGPHERFQFTFRAYMHFVAEKWLKYWLKKFSYPYELLDQEPPVIKLEKIIGLTGQVLVQAYDGGQAEEGILQFDVKGFGRPIDPELEARWAMILARAKSTEEPPSVDVNADVQQYQATDADLWPEEQPTEENEWPEE